MIYEFATLFSFFFLILIFIVNTYLISYIKESIKSNTEYLKISKKINILKNIILIILILLLISKFVLLLFGPDTLLIIPSFSDMEILIFVVNFFYAILWLTIIFMLIQVNNLKNEFILRYLKNIGYFISVLFFLDFIIEGIVYLTTISDYMTLSVHTMENSIAQPIKDATIVIIIIVALAIMLSILFVLFLIKRKMRILKYLELVTLLLLGVIGYLTFFYTGSIVGWNESLGYLLKLFSYSFGYTGFIFLIVLSVTLIANAGLILLFSVKEYFISEQYLRNKVINMIKVGFAATIILCCMAIWPHIYLWL